MAGKGLVEHSGIVAKTEGDKVTVKILAQSACISCKLNGVCGADTQEKLIEVTHVKDNYSIGEKVAVIMTEKLGMKALFYGYLMPFIVVLVTLLVVNAVTNNQGLSGLIAVGSLAPYYLILSLFKEKLKKSFEFNLHKSMQ